MSDFSGLLSIIVTALSRRMSRVKRDYTYLKNISHSRVHGNTQKSVFKSIRFIHRNVSADRGEKRKRLQKSFIFRNAADPSKRFSAKQPRGAETRTRVGHFYGLRVGAGRGCLNIVGSHATSV